MKIRSALTIKNICATAAVLIAVFAIISVVSEQSRSKAFFAALRGEAVTKANLFLEHQVDPATMQSIYLNNRQFINEVEVAVYSPQFDMLYHDAVQNDIVKEDRPMVDRIIAEGEIDFYVGDYQAVGLLYRHNGQDYVVTAAAYDGAGHASQLLLRRALLILFLAGLALLAAVCYLLARSALRPIRQITRQAENISASEIDKRLPVKNPGDELGELSSAFNDLLSRLEASFSAQRQFVSNVSHELRTPLAVVMAQLDLSLQKERTPEEYRQALSSALSSAKSMNSLVNGLLHLAKADYNKQSISMQDIRLDELLLDVRQRVLEAHPDYSIDIAFDIDADSAADDDRQITVRGNLYLLSIAFSNLIENNCKYSAPEHSCLIQISHYDASAIVRFNDSGMGMSERDKANLFSLFYRGENTGATQGHGIGMALALKIITMHGGTLDVRSRAGEGTTFIVRLPHL